MLAGKRIVLGVTGGIAAYKAVEISRRLVDAGAHVVPVMTEAAQRFLGPTTLSALSSEPVRTRLWDDPDTPIPHTKAGQAADLILIAPATARFVAAARMGYSDDLLSNIVLAARCPIMLCPAMHTEMWEYPAVSDNIATLRSWGMHIVEPESGRLAGGDSGVGRLADPERIVAAVLGLFSGQHASGQHASGQHASGQHASGRDDPDRGQAPETSTDATTQPAGDGGNHRSGVLDGAKVLISTGGTREPIDAVRVIANRSSGKQGMALARAALQHGASVTLVSTVPLAEDLRGRVDLIEVETCEQMRTALVDFAPEADVVVMAAAVADFRPVAAVHNKIKKRDGIPEIVLEPSPDILAELGASKPAGQVLVGFAAETDDLVANATSKLTRKNLDMVVANDVSAPGVGFKHDTNAVKIIDGDGGILDVPLATKDSIAETVFAQIAASRS